jgi:hypothetical protein
VSSDARGLNTTMVRQSQRSIVEGMALQMLQRIRAELEGWSSRDLALLRPELRDKRLRMQL